jgi:hypothetical protein
VFSGISDLVRARLEHLATGHYRLRNADGPERGRRMVRQSWACGQYNERETGSYHSCHG